MYTNVFIVSDHLLTIDVVAFLKCLEKETKHSVIWTGGGAASLIVFLRCLGFNYDQMIEKLSNLECLSSLIYAGCLDMNCESLVNSELDEWFEQIFEGKKLFNKDITLKEIYKMTKIFPNFITSTNNTIVTLNPKNTPEYRIIDCVKASLTNVGTIPSHIIDDTRYSSFSIYDTYPIDTNFELGEKTNTLSIFNLPKVTEQGEGYSNMLSSSFIHEYYKRVKERISRLDDDTVLINGFLVANLESRLNNGKKHYDWFESGQDTKDKMIELLEAIKNQS